MQSHLNCVKLEFNDNSLSIKRICTTKHGAKTTKSLIPRLIKLISILYDCKVKYLADQTKQLLF